MRPRKPRGGPALTRRGPGPSGLCAAFPRARGAGRRGPHGARARHPGARGRPDGLPVPGPSAASVPTSADGMPHFKDPDPRVWHRHPVPWPAGIANLTAPRAPAQRGCVCESQARRQARSGFLSVPGIPPRLRLALEEFSSKTQLYQVCRFCGI